MKRFLSLLFVALIGAETLRAAPPLDERLVQAAVGRAAGSLVQLRLASSQGRTQVTTGVFVSAEGLIATSDFAVNDREAALLAVLPDGRSVAAQVVAIDRVRQVALLKAALDGAAPAVPEPSSEEVRIGQWAIALGKTYSAQAPNVALGIVSAQQRLGGIAIQVDAKTSPANYGGLLVDLEGRALGLIVALPPVGEGRAAAIEYYDSGIGFAIPWSELLATCETLRAGVDLQPGRLGLTLRALTTPDEPARIGGLRADAPAEAAGVRAGDEIVSLEGRNVPRGRELAARLKRVYAGRAVSLGIVRDGQPLEISITPVEKLPPPQLAYLGVLPGEESSEGLMIRAVLPGSAAETAGIAAGDRLDSAAGEDLPDWKALAVKLLAMRPGAELPLKVLHGEATREVSVKLGAWDAASLPAELPPRASEFAKAAAAPMPAAPAGEPLPAHEKPAPSSEATGRIELPIPGREQPCIAYVPSGGAPARGMGLLIWLHGPEGLDEPAQLAAWGPLCEQHGLALVLPTSDEPRRWTADDIETIRAAAGEIARRVKIDPARTAIAGYQTGGAQALRVALEGSRFRGVAAVDAPLAVEPPEFDPARPMLIYLATSPGSRFARRIADDVNRLRQQGFSLAIHDLGPEPRPLNAEELAELARWADSLDRL